MFKWFKRKPYLEINQTPWEDTTFKILHELKYNRSPLNIFFPDDPQAYASFILEIDAKKQQLILDELFPQEGNQKANAGSKVVIRSRSQGVHVNFECDVVRRFNRHGLTGIVLSFPKGLDYMQRRDAFRVTPPESYPLNCEFKVQDLSLTSKVLDISLTGMRLCLKATEKLALKSHYIKQAQILLPDESNIRVEFKVCHYDSTEQDSWVLGCEFKQISAQDQHKINHCVTDLQRLNTQQKEPPQQSNAS